MNTLNKMHLIQEIKNSIHKKVNKSGIEYLTKFEKTIYINDYFINDIYKNGLYNFLYNLKGIKLIDFEIALKEIKADRLLVIIDKITTHFENIDDFDNIKKRKAEMKNWKAYKKKIFFKLDYNMYRDYESISGLLENYIMLNRNKITL